MFSKKIIQLSTRYCANKIIKRKYTTNYLRNNQYVRIIINNNNNVGNINNNHTNKFYSSTSKNDDDDATSNLKNHLNESKGDKIFELFSDVTFAKFCKYSHVQATLDESYNFYFREYMESLLAMEDDLFGITHIDRKLLNFGKEGDTDALDAYYETMKETGVPVSVNTFNIILYGHRLAAVKFDIPKKKKKKVDIMLAYLDQMKKHGIQPNLLTYNIIIDTITTERYFLLDKATDKLSSLLNEMKTNQISCDVYTYNSMFKIYYISNRFSKLKTIYTEMIENSFQTMKDEKCVPNSITYNLLVGFFVNTGDKERVKEILDEARYDTGLKPGVALYNLLLREELHPEFHTKDIDNETGEHKISFAKRAYNQMIQNSILPNLVTYTTMAMGYSRLFKLNGINDSEMEQILSEMKGKGFKLKLNHYHTLINWATRANKLNEAEQYLSEVISNTNMEPTLKMYCNVILCFARNNRIDDVVIYLSDLEKENLLTADKMNIHVLSRLYQDLISILWDEKANEDIIRRFIKEAYAKDCIIGFRGCLTQLIFDSFNEGNYAFAQFVLEQYVENTDDLKYLQFTRRLQSSLFLKVHHEEDKLNESNEEFQKLMKYIAYVDEKKMNGNLIGYSEAREKKKTRRRKKKKDNTMKMKKDMVREKRVKAPQIKNSYKNMYDNADEEKEIERNLKLEKDKLVKAIKKLEEDRGKLEDEKSILKQKEELFDQRLKVFDERQAIVKLERELLNKETQVFEDVKLQAQEDEYEEVVVMEDDDNNILDDEEEQIIVNGKSEDTSITSSTTAGREREGSRL